MVKRLVLMALALIVVFGGLYGFGKFRERAIAEYFASNTPPPITVEAATATRENWPDYLTAIGTIAAVRAVTVAPEVGGLVSSIAFESGQRVQAGAVLVQLNDAVEKGELATYQAQLRLAQANLARTSDLVRRQAAAQTTLDQNQAALDQANAGIARASAVIAQKRIVAPFAGQLGIRRVNLGEYVQPGGAIVSLTDLSELFVDLTLPEKYRSQVAVGQRVLISVDAFPGETFEGKVTSIDPQVDIDTRALKVQATMDNPGEKLLPGMFANVRVMLPPRPDLVTVPETAVDFSLYGDSVFVIRESGKGPDGAPRLVVTRTYVQVGDRLDNKAAILEGLKVGERVVTSGQLKLNNDAAVRVADTSTLTTPLALPNE